MAFLRSLLPGARRSEPPVPSDPPLVYLIAPAGVPNFGDEVIARTWIRHVAARHPDAEIVLDCHTPGSASVLLHREHPRLMVVDTVWRLAAALHHAPVEDAVDHMHAAIVDPGLEPHLASGVRLLHRASVIHVLGGGYVNALWPHNLLVVQAARSAARVGGARVAVTGQGVMPVPPSPSPWTDVLAAVVDDVDVVDARDELSAQVLRRSGGQVSVSGDDVWLTQGQPGRVYSPDDEAARRRWMFVVQSDLVADVGASDELASARIDEALRDLVDRWGIRGDDCAFVEGIPRTDRHAYERLSDALPGALFVPFEELWNGGLPARPGQVWISSRFHFHLLAAATGASGVYLPGRGDYYPVKHESLVAAGSRWVSLDDAGAQPPSAPGFEHHAVADRLAAKTAVADAIYGGL